MSKLLGPFYVLPQRQTQEADVDTDTDTDTETEGEIRTHHLGRVSCCEELRRLIPLSFSLFLSCKGRATLFSFCPRVLSTIKPLYLLVTMSRNT